MNNRPSFFAELKRRNDPRFEALVGKMLVSREGGVFVSKRNPKKLRGYVFWTGALTHVGNFSRKKHQFHD
jgi:hypothetical protein